MESLFVKRKKLGTAIFIFNYGRFPSDFFVLQSGYGGTENEDQH